MALQTLSVCCALTLLCTWKMALVYVLIHWLWRQMTAHVHQVPLMTQVLEFFALIFVHPAMVLQKTIVLHVTMVLCFSMARVLNFWSEHLLSTRWGSYELPANYLV